MKKRINCLGLAFILIGALSMSIALPAASGGPEYPDSPQQADGHFTNPLPRPSLGLTGTAKLMWEFFFNKPKNTVPNGAIPVDALSRADLEAAADGSVWRLGHSTVLIKLDGDFWLTDPVFSERASPVQWAGPKRFHTPPISLEDLPPLRAVLLSHDHYDHLDRAAVRALAAKTEYFFAPLGVGDRLIRWGIKPHKVQQFDWWQSVKLGDTELVATPSQHFSGRGLFDGSETLWASWAVIGREQRIFFSGDSGYFDGFRDIGERYGPFDLTLMETGAYDPRWAYVHMQPAQSLQAHIDLRGRTMVPIHNGTFDLAMHSWRDPFDSISALANERMVTLSTPRMGERVDVANPAPTTAWWTQVDDAITNHELSAQAM